MAGQCLLSRMEAWETCFQFNLLDRSIAFVREATQTKFPALAAEVFLKQLDLPYQAAAEMKHLVHFQDQVARIFTVQQMADLLGKLLDRGMEERLKQPHAKPFPRVVNLDSPATG